MPSEAFGCFVRLYLFTGKERDSESGNDYFGARYYASTMGRFLSPDWSAKAEPVPYAKLDNPQTLNLYQYMRNNPLGGTDSDGHCGDICNWVIFKVSTYVATHPEVAKALDKVGNSMGIKVALGGGGGGHLGPVKLEGSGTGYVSLSSKDGVGAGVDLSGGARIGPAGVEGNVNVPVVKDGQMVNPLTNAKVDGSANLTGESGKKTGTVGTNSEETKAGGTYGEGLVGGVEVSAGTDALKGLGRAVGDAAIEDTKQYVHDLKESTTCNGATCAVPH